MQCKLLQSCKEYLYFLLVEKIAGPLTALWELSISSVIILNIFTSLYKLVIHIWILYCRNYCDSCLSEIYFQKFLLPSLWRGTCVFNFFQSTALIFFFCLFASSLFAHNNCFSFFFMIMTILCSKSIHIFVSYKHKSFNKYTI